MVIAKVNNYTMRTGYIKNTYFYADCNIKISTRAKPEFELAGFPEIKDGSIAWLMKVLYGLPSSGWK